MTTWNSQSENTGSFSSQSKNSGSFSSQSKNSGSFSSQSKNTPSFNSQTISSTSSSATAGLYYGFGAFTYSGGQSLVSGPISWGQQNKS